MSTNMNFPSVAIQQMLFSLRDYNGDREVRLFCCACVRRVLNFVGRAEATSAVEIAEAYVEGLATADDLEKAEVSVRAARYPNDSFEITKGIHAAAWCVDRVLDAPFTARSVSSACACVVGTAAASEFAAQCILAQDIFPEFSEVLLREVSRTQDPRIEVIARRLYDDRLPSGTFNHAEVELLRTALQEIGYTDPAVMTHLKNTHAHVRGCWVVDVFLGKR